jgi:hypothetical protein
MEQEDSPTNKEEGNEVPPGCGLFFAWLAASAIATTLGWRLGWRLSFLAPGGLATAILGLTLGLSLGAAQWLVLRGHFRGPGWWIPVTALGWTVGITVGAWLGQQFGLAEIGFGIVLGTVTGLCLGAVQWLFLRRRVTRAGWWLPASTFAWASSLIYYQPGISWLGGLMGVLAGIVTGVAILWLIYRPVD